MRTSAFADTATSQAQKADIATSQTDGNDHAVKEDVPPEKEAGMQPADKHGQQPKPKSSFFQMMDSSDRKYWYVGALAAVMGGARFPVMALFVGDMFDELGRPGQKNFVEMVKPLSIYLVVVGLASGLARSLGDVCIAVLQHRMVTKYQHQYLETLLRKDCKWYDERGAATLLSNLSTSVFQVNDLYGPELATCIMGVAAFLFSMGIAISRSWQLGLIMLGTLPFLVFFTIKGFKNFMVMAKLIANLSGAAGMVLEQAVIGIKTVQSYGLESHMVSSMVPWVKMVAKAGLPVGQKASLYFSCRMGTEWTAAALIFFVGSRFVISKAHNPMTGTAWEPGNVFSVWFVQFLGITQLQLSTTYAQSFGEGKSALLALKVLQHEGAGEIEGPGLHSGRDDSAEVFEDVDLIEFDNVSFRYPSRPERLVLENITFDVKKGQKLALVGESGSGKSTVIQLMLRFYDPEAGEIRINGRDIRKIPLWTLRRCMALVEQEPVLFAASLRENLEYGEPARDRKPSEQSMQEAMNNCCMDFVNSLPEGTNTYVGARGGTLSGGQKQRTCIARALLREAKLLLLDEATAALDNQTEKDVQQTLDKIVATRGTSMTIAHRLSTIRRSDNILVFKDGHIVERGSHQDLMSRGAEGMYYGLVQLQDVAETAEAEIENKDSPSKAAELGNLKTDQGTRAARKTINVLTEDKSQVVDTSVITSRKFFKVMPKLMKGYLEDPVITFLLVLGWLGQICMMASNPFFAIILVSMLTGLYMEGDEQERRANESTLYLVLLAVLQFMFAHGRIGIVLTARQLQCVRNRQAIASNLMYQDVSYFDNPECTPAKLVVVYSSLINLGDELATRFTPDLLGALVTLVVTFIIALSKQVKIGLVVAAVWPVNMISKYLEFRDLMKKFRRGQSTNAETLSAQMFYDCILNLKTVRANQCELKMMGDFQKTVEQEGFKNLFGMVQTGLIKGVAYALETGLYAFAFWFAATEMDSGSPFEDCMQAMMCIMLGLMPLTGTLNAFDQLDRKLESGARMLDLKFHKPTLHKLANGNGKLANGNGVARVQPPDVKGKMLSFDQVRFRYAQRQDVEVLRSTSFKVQIGVGNMVGLCGPSGGGKSTVLALLSRFYDPTEGCIRMEGLGELQDLDLCQWRSCIGFVQQEPILFQDTLLNNVRYGNPDATPKEVNEAAEMAHFDFVSDAAPEFDPAEPLPPPSILLSGELKALGITQAQFERIAKSVSAGNKSDLEKVPTVEDVENVKKEDTGSVSWKDTVRSSSLSGGQKQRVAIARAFLRKPTILILDEATSALDSYSEKRIQDSLIACRKNQTQFLIAHRLSTISDADLILVVSMGMIAESGTAEDLLEKRGLYYNLVQSQSEKN